LKTGSFFNKEVQIELDSSKYIRKLRESLGENRREFSEHIGVPVRTLEDWESGRRTPPEYVPRLIAYQLKYEEMVKKHLDIEGEDKV
jgi:putative transcriptional regulator